MNINTFLYFFGFPLAVFCFTPLARKMFSKMGDYFDKRLSYSEDLHKRVAIFKADHPDFDLSKIKINRTIPWEIIEAYNHKHPENKIDTQKHFCYGGLIFRNGTYNSDYRFLPRSIDAAR